jgi:SAM-dependent methyltransferase
MSDWAHGYVTKVGYSSNYYQYLLPRLLSFAALSRGVSAPGGGTEKLRVLELGCGQGVSANIIAAANPELDYTAIDFNPAHIANAQALASAAGTPNVHFSESSFEDVANDPSTGGFDVVTLHGIYSWVSAANREHIIRIAREKLQPGGMLYISYNTYPGWASFVPIRKMLMDTIADNPNAPIFDQLNEGFRLLEQLTKLKSKYLEATPSVVAQIEQLKTQDRNYVVHEFLNQNWTIFNFGEVAADMARAKLSYIASAHVMDHLDGMNMTGEQREFLAAIRDPIRRESLRDLIVNQKFRRDIFVKGIRPLDESRSPQAWGNLRFALPTPASAVQKNLENSPWDAAHRAILDQVVRKLDTGPLTGQELLNGLQNVAAVPFRRVMIFLVGKGYCHVVPPESGESERNKRTAALNYAILCDGYRCNHLASPVLGDAVAADEIIQLILRSDREKIADPVNFIWETLKSEGKTIAKNGQTLDSKEKNLEELRRRVDEFDATRRRVLTNLEVY